MLLHNHLTWLREIRDAAVLIPNDWLAKSSQAFSLVPPTTIMSEEEKLCQTAPAVFAEWTVRQVRRGHHLVPFIGSGVSAASGILTGQDFMDYLTWVVYLCVAGPKFGGPVHHHDLRREGWPNPPNQADVEKAKGWVWRHFVDVCSQCGGQVNKAADTTKKAASKAMRDAFKAMKVRTLDPRDGVDPWRWRLSRPLVPSVLWTPESDALDREARELLRAVDLERSRQTIPPRHGQFSSTHNYVIEAAIRSLSEWRGALTFLARLRMNHAVASGAVSLADHPDQAVVDGFNRRITNGRRPNLAHNMLCHLAGRARVHTVLTTNFDNLIEEAFAEVGEPLEVLSVSVRGELPDPDIVRMRPSVVKLHGSLLETRADHSLDDPPSPEDRRRFFEYVRGWDPGEPARPGPGGVDGHLPGLLLVCGYSAEDLRCREMIQYVLEADRHATVLWIGYKEQDLVNLRAAFRDYSPETATSVEDCGLPRVLATITKRCDLLLYEIYQRLTLSLPKGGFHYQFNPNYPPLYDDPGAHTPPLPPDPTDSTERRTFLHKTGSLDRQQRALACDIWEEVREQIRQPGDHLLGRKILTVVGASGVMAPMRSVFRHVVEGERRQGVWLWLGDHPDVTSLAHELFTVMALRLGRFQLDHAQFGPKSPGRPGAAGWLEAINSLLEHWNVNFDQWFIVIDGRNGPGGVAGWGGRPWDDADHTELLDFMGALLDARNPKIPGKGCHLLYAPLSKQRQDRLKKRCEEVDEITKLTRDKCRSAAQATTSKHPLSAEFIEELAKAFNDNLAEHGEVDAKLRDHGWEATTLQTLGKAAVQPLESFPGTERLELFPLAASPSKTGAAASSRYKTQLAEGIVPNWFTKEDLLDPDAPRTQDAAARRALYAVSLFRQSRHFAAFLSEGVYPCPHRYNLKQLDNDWLRGEHIRKWLTDWKKEHTLAEKPGGFAWMYRDIRLGIQAVVEEGLRPVRLDAGTGRRWLHSAREARARMHFWIGDWYGRAFRATGHAEPLLEALHHYAQCIVHSPLARVGVRASAGPTDPRENDEAAYRQRLARRALFEIIKTLRLGRREIRFWLQNPAGEAWFGSTGSLPPSVVVCLRAVLEHLRCDEPPAGARSRLDGWMSQLQAELARQPQNADPLRVGFHTLDSASVEEEDFRVPSFFAQPELPHRPEDWWSELEGWLLREFQDHLKNVGPAEAVLRRFLIAEDGTGDPKLRGVLRLLHDFTTHPGPDADTEGLNSGFKGVAFKAGKELLDQPGVLFLLVQLTVELAYAAVQCAKEVENCRRVAASSELHPPPAASRLWIGVCALSWLALDLCLELPPALLAADCRLRIMASTLYGLALGRLGRFFEAHRRLNEAHGWLSKSESQLAPLEVAIIEIRRAEIHLLEAVRLRAILEALPEVVTGSGAVSCNFAAELAKADLDRETVEQWQEIYLPRFGPGADVGLDEARHTLLRSHIAKLDDSWLALEAAERSLSGRTHSTLWWGRLHLLRLRLFASHWWRRPRTARELPPRARMFDVQGGATSYLPTLYAAARIASHLNAYRELSLIQYTIQGLEADYRRLAPSKSESFKLSGDLAKRFRNILDGDFAAFKLRWGKAAGDHLGDYYRSVDLLLTEVSTSSKPPAGGAP